MKVVVLLQRNSKSGTQCQRAKIKTESDKKSINKNKGRVTRLASGERSEECKRGRSVNVCLDGLVVVAEDRGKGVYICKRLRVPAVKKKTTAHTQTNGMCSSAGLF